MIPDFSGDYLNFDSTQDGDVCEFVNEGKVEWNENLKKDMFNIQVKVNDRVKTYSPNQKAGSEFQKAFGMDTKDWKGKKFQVLHVQGKMVVRPILTERI